MVKSQYTDEPRVRIEMTHPVVLEQSDLDDLANGQEVRAPVTLSSEVVISAEWDDGIADIEDTDNGRDELRTDGGIPEECLTDCWSCGTGINRCIGTNDWQVKLSWTDPTGDERTGGALHLCRDCFEDDFGAVITHLVGENKRLVTDGGLLMATDDPHAEPLLVTDADGLHLPEGYIGHDGGLVARMPNGGTVDFKPRKWGATVGNVVPRHFGDVNGEGPNDHLEEDQVQLKKYGEEAEVFRVEVRR